MAREEILFFDGEEEQKEEPQETQETNVGTQEGENEEESSSS